MIKQQLEEKKKLAETAFNALEQKKQEIMAEQLRLQGEFRLLDELIKKQNENTTVREENA